MYWIGYFLMPYQQLELYYGEGPSSSHGYLHFTDISKMVINKFVTLNKIMSFMLKVLFWRLLPQKA